MSNDDAKMMSANRSFQTHGATALKAHGRRLFIVMCDTQAASESLSIAVISVSRLCLPTVGLLAGSLVQSGCDSRT